MNKDITIVATRLDGFRRYLADVYIINSDGSQIKLGDVLVKAGYADLMAR